MSIKRISSECENFLKQKKLYQEIKKIQEGALKKSITHWKRLYNWATTMSSSKKFDMDDMLDELGEDMDSDYCACCQTFSMFDQVRIGHDWNCGFCPLNTGGIQCEEPKSPWRQCRDSKTYGGFVKNANSFIDIMDNILKGNAI